MIVCHNERPVSWGSTWAAVETNSGVACINMTVGYSDTTKAYMFIVCLSEFVEGMKGILQETPIFEGKSHGSRSIFFLQPIQCTA